MDSAIPIALYKAISPGRVEKGMPPFGPPNRDSLTETERWSAIASLYDLATASHQLNAGGRLFAKQCAGYHGETGTAELSNGAPPLANFTYWSSSSDAAVRQRISQSVNHPFHLAEAELKAVVRFARRLSNQDEINSELVGDSRPTASFTIRGKVFHGRSRHHR